jgi:hypothetical protein
MSRREVLLASALAVAAVGYLWIRSGKTSQEAAAAAAASRARGEVVAATAPVVRMDLLDRPAASYDGGGRDLFQYSVRPPSAEEVRQRELEAKRQREQAELEARLRAEAAAREQEQARVRAVEIAKNPPKPPPPPINLKYVGFVGPKDDKVAVFEDGDDLVVAKKGEVVKGQFRVVDIKFEAVVMGYTRPEFKDATRELTLSPASR